MLSMLLLPLSAILFGCSHAAFRMGKAPGSYVRMGGVDATCAEARLYHARSTSIVELMRRCDMQPNCRGFNTKGLLHRNTQRYCMTTVPGVSLYVKYGPVAGAKQGYVPPSARVLPTKGPTVSPIYRAKPAQAANNGFYAVPPGRAGLPVAQPSPPPRQSLVPLPKSLSKGTVSASLQPDFAFTTQTSSDDVKAFMRAVTAEYRDLIFTHRGARNNASTGRSSITGMNIVIRSTSLKLGLATDESYTLSIPSSGQVTLRAQTVYGARHGLETFSQLTHFDQGSAVVLVENTPIEVDDRPRFPHRGVLLDTARHYHSVTTIKQFIRSLSHAKFNVFHWHIVDSQSFPLQLKSLPDAVKGAYTLDDIYTPSDVQDIVAYAKLHGVRVIPEFDTPGHAKSWCTGYPEICPSSTCTEPLNPATNKTFDVIGKLLAESKELFEDEFLHLGGDEVDTKCWTATASIRKWMSLNKFNARDAYKYFVRETLRLTTSLGRKGIFWEEVFSNLGAAVDRDAIIHVWLDRKWTSKILAQGYQCIISEGWYLDHLDKTWRLFYANDPHKSIRDSKHQRLILGGEACMWSETVDASNLFSTVWPRAAATAERLWSEQSVVDMEAFEKRLRGFRCMLTRRGIGSGPVDLRYGRSPPSGPGACYQ